MTTDTLDDPFVDVPLAAEESKPAAQKRPESTQCCFMCETAEATVSGLIEKQLKWLRT